MKSAAKVFERAKATPGSLTYDELIALANAAGYVLTRQKGSHAIYKRANTIERMNFQRDGKTAKRYQVNQLLDVIERYAIEIE